MKLIEFPDGKVGKCLKFLSGIAATRCRLNWEGFTIWYFHIPKKYLQLLFFYLLFDITNSVIDFKNDIFRLYLDYIFEW